MQVRYDDLLENTGRLDSVIKACLTRLLYLSRIKI